MANVELAKAYVTIVPSMEGAQTKIADELTSSMGSASDKVGDLVGTNIGSKATAALSKFAAPAAIATAGVAIGKQLFDVGQSFDAMYDTIAVGTGATGEVLDQLNASAREVAAGTSQSIDQVGSTLADLNTRTGATGDTLEGLTEQFLKLDQMGQSADVNTVTGAFNAWGISAEDMGDALDDLFIVSQSTGIGIDQLASTMGTSASTMKALGFSFQDTASMAGLFDKAGLNASGMMSKLSKAATTLAKDGKDPAKAFQENIDKMQAYLDKGNEAAAIDLASELFGTKGATQFVQALQSGTMNIEELSAAVSGTSGDIAANADATASWDQSMAKLQNNAMLLLEPLGSAVFTGASVVLGMLADGAEFAYNGICDLYDAMMANEDVQGALESISSIVTDVGDIAGTAFGMFQSAMAPLQPVITAVGNVLGGAFSASVRGVSALIGNAASVMDSFKALMHGEIKFPDIKLPHITITPAGWTPDQLLKGKVPSIGIDWYAKGGYFDEPTVIGVGESGGEYVLNDRQIDGLAERIGGNGGDVYITINMNGNCDPNEVAMVIANKLKQLNMIKGGGPVVQTA